MDVERIRLESSTAARGLGVIVPAHLPLLDRPSQLRPTDRVIMRALALNVVAACAYGYSRQQGLSWLDREDMLSELSPAESKFLVDGQGKDAEFQLRVECIWALSWALGVIPVLDFSSGADQTFFRALPDLKQGEGSERFRAQVSPRTLDRVLAKCDLAYCLHWGIVANRQHSAALVTHVIVERRRALEWMTSDATWDDVPLDT